MLPALRPVEYFGPIISLVSFNNLKVIEIAALFLERTDNGTRGRSLINIFPPSLETLHVTRLQSCFHSVLQPVEHLLAQKSPQQIPSLKILVLEETKSFARSPVKLMNVLWMGAQKRGTQETAIGRLSRVAAAQDVSTYSYVEALADEESIVAK